MKPYRTDHTESGPPGPPTSPHDHGVVPRSPYRGDHLRASQVPSPDGGPGTGEDDNSALAVTVYGLPAPQGSKRVVRGRLIDANATALRPWRAAVADAARQQLGDTPAVEGPLTVLAVFTLPRPASAPKRRRWPDRKPDIDKLARALLDALTDGGVFLDDAQVCRLVVEKRYVGDRLALAAPGMTAQIVHLEQEAAA